VKSQDVVNRVLCTVSSLGTWGPNSYYAGPMKGGAGNYGGYGGGSNYNRR
jgi:hypothetical protein